MHVSEGIRSHIRVVIANVTRIDTDEVRDDVLFREELGIDSLLGMEIIAACERQLSLHIDESRCADIVTVGDFLDYLEHLARR